LRQNAASPLAWPFDFHDRVTRIFQSKISQPPKAAFGVSIKKATLSYIMSRIGNLMSRSAVFLSLVQQEGD
jgi:hypothetical protein